MQPLKNREPSSVAGAVAEAAAGNGHYRGKSDQPADTHRSYYRTQRVDIEGATTTIRDGMDKTFKDAHAALHDLRDGATILAGGFGLSGNPENCIRAIRERGTSGLTIVSNNCGTTDKGLGILLANGQVKRMVSSYVGENKVFRARLFLDGKLAEVELCPQGTHRRAACAPAAPASPPSTRRTGYGTKRAEGKETRQWNGRWCILEEAITGDFAIVKAWKGDRWGNLVYRKTARNFNPMCAAAGRVTVAEVEEIVEVAARLATSRPDPHAGHLRAAHLRRYELREADRATDRTKAELAPTMVAAMRQAARRRRRRSGQGAPGRSRHRRRDPAPEQLHALHFGACRERASSGRVVQQTTASTRRASFST